MTQSPIWFSVIPCSHNLHIYQNCIRFHYSRGWTKIWMIRAKKLSYPYVPLQHFDAYLREWGKAELILAYVHLLLWHRPHVVCVWKKLAYWNFTVGQKRQKAQRTRGLRSFTKLTSFLIISYHKFVHKSWSNFSIRILIKLQLQNLNQTSASKYWPNFSLEISASLTLVMS